MPHDSKWWIEPDPSGFKVRYPGGPAEGGFNPQAGKPISEVLRELEKSRLPTS